MEIIMINESKLKVMLSREDLQSFDITAEDLDYSNTETKRMFWDILNQAKHDTGFDTDGQKVLVQLYPSREGGCEIFVTKIGVFCSAAEETSQSKPETLSSSKTAVQTKPQKKALASRNRKGAYSFEKLDYLIGVCRRLHKIGYAGESSAYICDNDKCYLILSDIEAAGFIQLNEFSFISEYGTPENLDMLKLYISEHGKAICERNAVETLADF